MIASRRLVVGAMLLLASATLGTASDEPERVGLEEYARTRLITARFRVERAAGAAPGACLDLEPADLRVRLRGRRLPAENIVALERDRRPALHALLLDTSTSMEGRLERVREAARRYVAELRPGLDRAMVLEFDHDLRLVCPPSGDGARLRACIDAVHLGGGTAILDALHFTLLELSLHVERPVVVLLTDGVDMASVVTQDQVFAQVDRLDGLALFAIGLMIPHMSGGGTPKKFLDLLARRADGELFDVPTGSGLERAFLAVRERLDREWELAVEDPDPEGPPETLSIGLPGKPCDVRPLRPPPSALPEEPPRSLAAAGPCPTDLRNWARNALVFAPPLGSGWWARWRGNDLEGCVVDLAMDDGPLFSAEDVERQWFNYWRESGPRPFRLLLPELEDLPVLPEQVLDSIAPSLAAAARRDVPLGDRQVPPWRHARPFRDVAELWNGRTLLVTRQELARALAARPDYATFSRRALEREAREELDAWAARLAAASPGRSEEELRRALEISPRGQAILARAERPGARDLARHLAAWLGDISAAELLRAWEARAIERRLRNEEPDAEAFVAQYESVRTFFFVPSYARVLAPLVAGRDARSGDVGFWRIVLPRSSWMFPRVKGAGSRLEYASLPLDLVPPAPLAFGLVTQLEATQPELVASLRGQAVRSVEYESLVAPFRRDPPRAFREARVRIRFDSVVLVADVDGESVFPPPVERLEVLESGLPEE